MMPPTTRAVCTCPNVSAGRKVVSLVKMRAHTTLEGQLDRKQRDRVGEKVSSHIFLFVNRFLLAAISDSRVGQTKGHSGKRPSRTKLLLLSPAYEVY